MNRLNKTPRSLIPSRITENSVPTDTTHRKFQNLDFDKLHTQAREKIMCYWPADTLFWHLSIDRKMNVQYRRLHPYPYRFVRKTSTGWLSGTPLPYFPECPLLPLETVLATLRLSHLTIRMFHNHRLPDFLILTSKGWYCLHNVF